MRVTTPEQFARLDYTAAGPAGPQARITLHDDLDLAVATQLQDTLDKLAAIPACPIVVDLAQVTFLSSTGMGFLAAVYNRATEHGHAVTVTSPTPIVRRALEICGFDKAMTITG